MTLWEFLSDRLDRILIQAVCAAGAAFFLRATGTQAGVLLERGKVVLGPVEGGGTVNRLLNAIGVWHRPGEDEFDALGLGRYRHMPL